MGFLKRYVLRLYENYFVGKKQFQRFFNITKVLSIRGLNYGNGGSIEYGGEINLMRYLANKYVDNRIYIVFDVGANEGSYCASLVKNIQIKSLQIWCFEPAANTFKNLAAMCGAKQNIFLYNIGFSNQNGKNPLYIDYSASDIASLFPLERAFGTTEKLSDFEMVEIKKIDDFLIENNVPYIDLLKLDIEGNELNALLGASDAIKAGKIKSIQFEFGTCNIDSRTFFRDFWNLLSPQYNLFRIIRDGLQPIIRYTEYEEVFTTINYYAELK